MKKLLFFLTTLLLLSMPLSGCAASKPYDEPVTLSLLGGSATGTIFMVVNGINECVNMTYPGSVIQLSPGGVVGNLERLAKDEADAGITHSVFAHSAYHGLEPFQTASADLRAVASFYTSTMQMVLEESLGVTHFDQIVDEKIEIRISVDKPDSSGFVIFKRMIAEYGLTVEDMEAWGCEIHYKTFAESDDMLQDGLLDGYCISTLFPAPVVVESALSTDLTLVHFNTDVLNSMVEKYNNVPVVIPGETYDFEPDAVDSIGSTVVMVVKEEVSEETTYKIAKALVENIDYMHSVHSALEGMTPESICQNLGVPLHPGAERYFKEIKVLD